MSATSSDAPFRHGKGWAALEMGCWWSRIKAICIWYARKVLKFKTNSHGWGRYIEPGCCLSAWYRLVQIWRSSRLFLADNFSHDCAAVMDCYCNAYDGLVGICVRSYHVEVGRSTDGNGFLLIEIVKSGSFQFNLPSNRVSEQQRNR